MTGLADNYRCMKMFWLDTKGWYQKKRVHKKWLFLDTGWYDNKRIFSIQISKNDVCCADYQMKKRGSLYSPIIDYMNAENEMKNSAQMTFSSIKKLTQKN